MNYNKVFTSFKIEKGLPLDSPKLHHNYFPTKTKYFYNTTKNLFYKKGRIPLQTLYSFNLMIYER